MGTMAKIDDSVKKKVPELRFKGFTDDWEERKLKDYVGPVISDGDWIEKEHIHDSGVYRIIQTGNLGLGEFHDKSSSAKYMNEESFNILNANEIFPNDILISRLADPAGRTIILPDTKNKMVTAVDVTIIRPNKLFDSYFFITEMNSTVVLNKISKSVSGTSHKRISRRNLELISLLIPSLEEQQKIGTFFKQLDDIIALHQRKLDLLKEQKKGYLQKMFPKNGEKVPELRFAGFADDWEQRKLGDEVRIVMGQSPNSENYTDDPNDYILVQGNADMKNGRVLPRVWTTQVTKQAEKDDLILSVRAPVGDIGKTAYDVVIGRGVAAIKGNEFIFQNLGKMKSDGYWTRYSTGSTFESINSTDIKEAIISVPAIEEQDKIGSFFKQLDNTIALHQRKLDLLKEQKKGYLQKMFV